MQFWGGKQIVLWRDSKIFGMTKIVYAFGLQAGKCDISPPITWRDVTPL